MSSVKRFRQPETLRSRLTLWYVAALGLALATFAMMLYIVLSRTLYSHHDSELQADANRFTAVLAKIPLNERSLEAALSRTDAVPALLMVRDSTGGLLYRSPVLQVAEPSIGQHAALIHAAAHGPAAPEFFTATLERTGAVRFICTRLGAGTSAYLQIGSALGDVPATLRTVAAASAVLVPVVLLLTSVGGWVVAGRALAPIAAIDRTVRAIEATDLSKRIELSRADEELQGLVRTVNGLLARLERSFADLRNFAADVSHQLKTPLAVMQSTIDSGRAAAGPADPVFDAIEGEIHELCDVITDLQALNLVDSVVQGDRTAPVDFSQLCEDAMEIVHALGEAAGVSITTDIDQGVCVVGRPAQLRQLILNLGDNAVKFTPDGGRVMMRLRRVDQTAVMTLSDTGPGIEPHDLARIFDRFYRARHTSARGSGLGLAIAQRIVFVHGGEIEVSSRVGEGTMFTVQLPVA